MIIFKFLWVLLQLVGTLILTVLVSIILLQTASQQPQLRLKFQAFVVSSGSMEPTIMTGDVIFIRPQKSYGVDDIVTFASPEGPIVTHRIIETMSSPKGEILIQTKGDNNQAKDPYTISGSAIKGALWFSIPMLGYLEVYAKTPTGLVIIFSLTLGWLVSDITWNYLSKQQVEKPKGS